MPPKSLFTKPAWITALGALLFLTLLAILEPQTFLWDDNLCQFSPWYEFDYQAFCRGEIPQINYYQYLGEPYLSSAQNGFFYPPVLVAMILAHAIGAPELGLQWLVWVHLALAAVAFERLAREFKVSAPRSILCSWLFLTTPYLICGSQAWVLHTYVVLYVILTVLLLEQLRKKVTVTQVVLLGIVKALFILSGHINYFALSLIYEVLFIVIRKENGKQFLAMSGIWLLSMLCGILGSLPSLGPTLYHLSTAADRSTPLSLDKVLDLAIPPLAIFGAQAGVYLTQTYIFQSAWYFLGGSLIFWPLYIHFRRNPDIRMCGILMVAALAFCTDAFYLIHLLPGYHSFRWPAKSVLFALIFYPLGVGLICESFPEKRVVFRALLLLSITANFFVCLDPQAHLSVIVKLPRFTNQFHLPLSQLQSARSQAIAMYGVRSFDPDFLTYNFGTLAKVPVVNGYDALVNAQNKHEALEEEYIGLPWKPLSSERINHMREWSVRYYLFDKEAPNPPGDVSETRGWKRVGQFSSVVVWEDLAANPLAYFEDDPGTALPVEIQGNQLVIQTTAEQKEPRILSLAWVPLPGYAYRFSGQNNELIPILSADQGRMRFSIPPHTERTLVVQYSEPFLAIYIGIALAFYAIAISAICIEKTNLF